MSEDPELDTADTLLKEGARLLKDSTETPRLEAEILLSELLKLSRTQLILHSDQSISKDIAQKYWQLVESRQKHKPISQLIRKKPFWKWEFEVNDQVLTPRPETEKLLELGLVELQRILRKHSGQSANYWDLACGSGILGVSLLKEASDNSSQINPQEKICIFLLSDLSADAIRLTKKNLSQLCPTASLSKNYSYRILQSDLDENIPVEEKFDLILSNPPYLPEPSKNFQYPPELSFEPTMALYSGENGLDLYQRIIKMLQTRLKPDGVFWGEIYPGSLDALTRIINDQGLKLTAVEPTSNNLPGFVRIVRPN